ncbi:MAG TPA: HEXXH motif-containing putative peptide modification protein [Myxococcota bacterium]|nr:HEXXH motif-containing putative peptide modification protein [Myxococcota bacterium]
MDAPWTLPCAQADLAAMRGRTLRLSLKWLLDWPSPLPPALRRPYAELRELLTGLYRQAPAELLSSLSLPVVGAPIGAATLGPDSGQGLLAAVPSLLAELGRRGRLGRAGFWWGAPISRLLSPPLGLARRWEQPAAGALFRDGEVDLGPEGILPLLPSEKLAFWPLEGGGWLAGADNNPLAMMEAHPDKEGNALDLGTESPERWVEAMNSARALVAETLPELAAEHRSLLALVVPVGTHGARSLSASYREAIGQVYVSFLEDPRSLAEALVHETQHNKLNLLSLVDPILEDRGEEKFKSPVRPDPRPLWGILLAVHAFLPVAEMYRRLQEVAHPTTRSDRFLAHFAEIREGNHEGMELLRAHARPTALGRQLLQGMDLLERRQWEWS